MKIIAFDSECSRDYGLYCEMCMFGYVVADENFNVELSNQLYINASKPTGRSKKYMRSDMAKVSDAPVYKKVRPHISSVFTYEDAIYVAHSPETTFRYIYCMDRRNNLQGIRCRAFDIYTIVRNYADIPSYGLSDIAKTFNIPYDRKESNVDAKACIRILEYICREENINIHGLLDLCGKGSTVDSEVIQHNIQLKIKQEKLEKYYSMKPKEGPLSGKIFSMSESFESIRIEMGFRIADFITHNGGILTKKASESQYLVWDGNIESKRLESVNRMPDGIVSVISTDELFSLTP